MMEFTPADWIYRKALSKMVSDTRTREERSRNMAQIKGKNTRPELAVRSLLHQMGYRFRLHRQDLPGKPDIVLPKYKTVVLVHGCFWHMHSCKRGRSTPATNSDFWKQKREKTRQRDASTRAKLRRMGWHVIIVWECQIKDLTKLCRRFHHSLPKR